MGTVDGLRKFQTYLEDTEGARLLCFLIDSEQLKRIPNFMTEAKARIFREMQIKYFGSGKDLFDAETVAVFQGFFHGQLLHVYSVSY